MRPIYAALLLATSISMFAAEGGDWRLREPPLPPMKVKFEDLESSVRMVIPANVAKAIQQTDPPQIMESVSLYFRKMGTIFYGMSTNLNFKPEDIQAAMAHESPIDQGHMLDVSRLIQHFYSISFRDRNNAEYPPAEWMLKVSNLFGSAIDAGLQKAGKQGIRN